MTDTILFDLDGTLLPVTTEEFTNAYFGELWKAAIPLGYEKESFIRGIWAGTAAMIENDGAVMNRARFWDKFKSLFGEQAGRHEAEFDRFYATDFNKARITMKEQSVPPRELVDYLISRGFRLVLATNPIFPEVAVRSRLDWIGLDFNSFALVTSYENSRFCKPNVKYFEEVLDKISAFPAQCIMVGNNTHEDMCAGELGVETFLVTEFLENSANMDVNRFRHGTLLDFLNYVKSMGL